jgi:hypothetical protein
MKVDNLSFFLLIFILVKVRTYSVVNVHFSHIFEEIFSMYIIVISLFSRILIEDHLSRFLTKNEYEYIYFN